MSYIDYDEYGEVEVRCMNCNTPIAGRTYIEIPSRTEIGKTVNVLAMKTFGNARKVKVELSDGTFAFIKVCEGCENKKFDMDKMSDLFHDAWEKEARAAHKTEGDIQKLKTKVKKLKVKGRIK